MYKYYRAMGTQEANGIIDKDIIINNQSVSYWADSYEVAQRYQTAGRVIVMIVTDRPIPDGYKGVAHFTDAPSHIEYVVPKSIMNVFLGNQIEEPVIA